MNRVTPLEQLGERLRDGVIGDLDIPGEEQHRSPESLMLAAIELLDFRVRAIAHPCILHGDTGGCVRWFANRPRPACPGFATVSDAPPSPFALGL